MNFLQENFQKIMYLLFGCVQKLISWHLIILKKAWEPNGTVFNDSNCLEQQAKDYGLKDSFAATVCALSPSGGQPVGPHFTL